MNRNGETSTHGTRLCCNNASEDTSGERRCDMMNNLRREKSEGQVDCNSAAFGLSAFFFSRHPAILSRLSPHNFFFVRLSRNQPTFPFCVFCSTSSHTWSHNERALSAYSHCGEARSGLLVVVSRRKGRVTPSCLCERSKCSCYWQPPSALSTDVGYA